MTFLRSQIVRYSAPIRFGIFVGMLTLLWLPIATPIYFIWRSSSTVGIALLLILYTEFIWLLRRWGRHVHQQLHPLYEHGLKPTSRNQLEFLISLVFGFASIFALFGLEGWFGWLTWQALPPTLIRSLFEGLVVAIAVSFAEELLFRGWIVDEFRLDYGYAVALWISSTIYAAVHFIKPWTEIIRTLPSFPGLLLLGLTLGWARQRYQGRLGVAIGLHAGLVWGYYLVDVTDSIAYTDRVPTWVTGIDQNPLAGIMGLGFLGLIALGICGTKH